MAVRAKMRCTGRREWTMQKFKPGMDERELVEHVEVTLQPVYAEGPDDKSNADWSKWTPSGEVKLTITNKDAFDQFKIGRAYFVDFSVTEN